jgi:nucleolin
MPSKKQVKRAPSSDSDSDSSVEVKKAPVKKVSKPVESGSDSDSSVEVKKAPARKTSIGNKRKASTEAQAKKPAQKQAKTAAKATKKAADSSDEDSSEEEAPAKKAPAKKAPAKKVQDSDSDSSEDEAPKRKISKASKSSAKGKKKVESDSDSSSEEEVKKPVRKASKAKKVEDSDDSDSDDEPKVRRSSRISSRKQSLNKPAEDDGVETELFVGNLPWSVDENVLGEKFGAFGTVNNVKLLYNDKGQSKGIAFVTMASSQQGNAAVEAMSGAEIDGRQIRCNLSADKSQLGQRQERAPRQFNQGGDVGESKSLFVGNIPFSCTQETLGQFFGDGVTEVRIAMGEDGRMRGFAHVEFSSHEDAKKALELNGQEFEGRALRLDLSAGRSGGGGGGRGGRGGFRGGDRGGFRGGDRGGRGGFGRGGDRGGFRGGRGGRGGVPQRGRSSIQRFEGKKMTF